MSQQLGYTVRGKGQIKVPTLSEMKTGLLALGLDASKVAARNDSPTPLGNELLKYFEYRALVLNTNVRAQLMNAAEAEKLYMKLRAEAV